MRNNNFYRKSCLGNWIKHERYKTRITLDSKTLWVIKHISPKIIKISKHLQFITKTQEMLMIKNSKIEIIILTFTFLVKL